MSIEPDPLVITEEERLSKPFPNSMKFEKPVKGRVVSDEPLARNLVRVTDNTLIGQEKAKIIQWERSIENLTLKISERKSQIKDAKKRIKLYEKAAALK